MITVLSGNGGYRNIAIEICCFGFFNFCGLFSRVYELCESIFKLLLVSIFLLSLPIMRTSLDPN